MTRNHSLRGKLQFTAGWLIVALALVALTFTPVAQANIRLAGIFTDYMVLQQGMKVPVWGWADDGEEVSVQFQGQRVTTVAKDGLWMVRLNSLRASAEPEVMKVSGKNRVQVNDVLVGEVWVCSGQSNMEWPLSKAFESQVDIAASSNPQIRLYSVPKLKANEPASDIKGVAWLKCEPVNSTWFSAVGYYFGRELQKALDVPVGLIHTSWGGSPAEVWMSRSALEAKGEYINEILQVGEANWQKYTEAKGKYDAAVLEAKKKNTTATEKEPRAPWRPTELYNGMIYPLIPYAIRGAIWYQGESNAGRAWQYRTLFPDMIKNWRKDWGQGDFPFLAVQLAPFKAIKTEPGESDWAELREAQLFATKQPMKNVGMVVITDVGDEKDIHPTKKAPVGARLALAAQGIAYGKKITYSGPIYKNMRLKSDKASGDRLILSFDHVGQGLEAKGGELKGFSICGADKKFVWAKAEILPDNTIAVSAPDLKKPVAVRYGWADYPLGNLWNKDGLPASPFRTDDFPMITAPEGAQKKK